MAMDHAQGMGVPPGLEDPAATLDKILDGADGIMTSYGVIKHYRDRLIGRIPTFLRLDGGPSVYRGEWLRANEWMLFHSVEDARRLGVDGVCLMGFMGAPVETITYEPGFPMWHPSAKLSVARNRSKGKSDGLCCQ